MALTHADEISRAGFSSIVAFISDGKRAALSRLLAERTALSNGILLFATSTEELQRTATHASLVLIEGSRLAELAAGARVREVPYPRDRAMPDLGDAVLGCLERLPPATGGAFRVALQGPRAWSVKRVAHAAGISTRQLVRQCAAASCVVSPRDLLLAARLAYAQSLLRGPRSYSVAALAHACGWVDARSLRAALRRARLPSTAALAGMCGGAASVSDLVTRIARRGT